MCSLHILVHYSLVYFIYFIGIMHNGIVTIHLKKNTIIKITIKIHRGVVDKNAECYQCPVMYCIIQSISVLSKPSMNDCSDLTNITLRSSL